MYKKLQDVEVGREFIHTIGDKLPPEPWTVWRVVRHHQGDIHAEIPGEVRSFGPNLEVYLVPTQEEIDQTSARVKRKLKEKIERIGDSLKSPEGESLVQQLLDVKSLVEEYT